MQDTPEHIKQLQLDIWLSKTISERLEQFILDNDALFKLWQQAKQQISTGNQPRNSYLPGTGDAE